MWKSQDDRSTLEDFEFDRGADPHAKLLALLYAFWALAETALQDAEFDRDQFFCRNASALELLLMTGNFDAADELTEILEPLARKYYPTNLS
jgi:hypothetical protein